MQINTREYIAGILFAGMNNGLFNVVLCKLTGFQSVIL
jgi:hypothetical protein